MPRPVASAIRSRRNASTSATIRPSNEASRSFCFGAARVCISTRPAPVSAHTSASKGSRSPLTSFHDRGARSDRGAGNRRLVRIDGDQHVELGRDTLDQRDDPLDLDVRIDRRPVRYARLASRCR